MQLNRWILFLGAIVMPFLFGCKTSPEVKLSEIIKYAHENYRQGEISQAGANFVNSDLKLDADLQRVWSASFLVLGQSGLILKADDSRKSMIVLLLEDKKPAMIAEVQIGLSDGNPHISLLQVRLGEPVYFQKRNQNFLNGQARSDLCDEIANEVADQAVPSRVW